MTRRLETADCMICGKQTPLHLLDAKPPHRDAADYIILACEACYGEPEVAVGEGRYIRLKWCASEPSYVSDPDSDRK